MKARVKKTGELLKIAEYAKIAMDNCDSFGNPLEYSPEEIELIDDTVSQSEIDWEQRRYEIAKAAMQGQLSNQYGDVCVSGGEFKEVAKNAVRFADALIAKLKEGGEQ